MEKESVIVPRGMIDSLWFMSEVTFIKMVDEIDRKLDKIKKEERKYIQWKLLFIWNKAFSFLCNNKLDELYVKKTAYFEWEIDEGMEKAIKIKHNLKNIKKEWWYHTLFHKIDKAVSKLSWHKLDEQWNIYLISDGEHTKIWATTYNITKRLNELQTGNSKLLKIIWFYEVKNKISTESFLHEKHQEKHILWEWYKLWNEDIKDIMDHKYDIINEYGFTTLREEDSEKIVETLHDIIIDMEEYNQKIAKRKKNKMEDILNEYKILVKKEQIKRNINPYKIHN